MTISNHFKLMARYNQWMNAKVYEAASSLEPTALFENRGAFFGSVFGTLNHIMVADTIWLKRFSEHPVRFRSLEHVQPIAAPASLKGILHEDFASLRQARQALDGVILDFVDELVDENLISTLRYSNMAGQAFEDELGALVGHLFNHQTHHRGQITTLLSQAGIDVGVTDLVALTRELRKG